MTNRHVAKSATASSNCLRSHFQRHCRYFSGDTAAAANQSSYRETTHTALDYFDVLGVDVSENPRSDVMFVWRLFFILYHSFFANNPMI